MKTPKALSPLRLPRPLGSSQSSWVQEELKRLGSPAEVLRSHNIPVKRSKAVCPFHDDRNPSLSLFRGKDGRERWRCHACDLSGDAIDLDRALRGVR